VPGGAARLPRAERIRKRAAFQAVQSRGRKLHTESFLVFVLPSQCDAPRLGVTVSKKVGGAVQRNRVKRLVREAFRRRKALFPRGIDLVFIAKKSAISVDGAQVGREIEVLCARYFK
jgi:ribonuclease P protein component